MLRNFKNKQTQGGNMFKNKKGFSLIEMLVAMTLIGILSAIAMPAYNNYRKDANKTVLKSDAGNAYKAMHTYNAVNGTFCAALATLGLGALKISETYVGTGKKGFIGFDAHEGCDPAVTDLNAGTGMTLNKASCKLKTDSFLFAVANTFASEQVGYHVTNLNSSPKIAGTYCADTNDNNAVLSCTKVQCDGKTGPCTGKTGARWTTGGSLCQ